VEDGGVGCERGDKCVAAARGLCRWAVRAEREAGQEQQAAIGQWLFPFWRHTLGQGAGGANDDGLRAAQKDAQALFLDR
jgi:hypothetical protein